MRDVFTLASALALYLLVCCVPSAAAKAPSVSLHVSPYARPGGDGSPARPFTTISQALERLRQIRGGASMPSAAEIVLAGGEYSVTATIELGPRDSFLTIRPARGQTAVLMGGRSVLLWEPVRDPDVRARLGDAAPHVMQADLREAGVRDFGALSNRGFGRPLKPAHLELFFEGLPARLAGWPDEGWARIADVPGGPDAGVFCYEGDRPSRWKDAREVWVHGYWTWDWADSYERVESLDPATRQVRTAAPHGVYGYKAGARFRFLNVLEELDSPNEYYVDAERGILYFWPPQPPRGHRVQVSVLEEPMFTITGATGVVLSGLTLECTRGTAVVITDGRDNLVQDCTIRNVGNVGVVIGERREDYQAVLYANTTLDRRGGSGNGVRRCHIYNTGDNAVLLGGGDRKTLTPAGNFVEDCHIHHFSRWGRTYRPAIALDGVGNRVLHNRIHDSPHSAIIAHGNEHLVAYNDIGRVCLETNDAGAFYIGRDFTQRGNRVICNYFHDLGEAEQVHAVYLDDCASGTIVRGNLFYRAGASVFIGGGRDNVVENNIFVKCRPGMLVDARGLDWASFWFDGRDDTLMKRLAAVGHDRPPYSVRYPALRNILSDDPAVPKGNRLERNICYDGACIKLKHGVLQKTVRMKDNWTAEDPGFAAPLPENPGPHDFRLRPDAPVWKTGFRPIPVEKIGPRGNALK